MVKTTDFHARLTEAERVALESMAEFEAMNLSEAARLAIREAAKERGLWPAKLTPTAGGVAGVKSEEAAHD